MSNTRRATGIPPAQVSAAAKLRAEALFANDAEIPVVIREQTMTFLPFNEWDIDVYADLDDAMNGDLRKWRPWAEACLVDPGDWDKVRPRPTDLESIFTQINEFTGGELGKLGALSA